MFAVWGREMASTGIVVSGILPGAFYGPDNVWRRHEANRPEMVQQFIEDRLPLKRIAEPDEIIPLIAFLASSGASMMGGSCVPIDAGEGKGYAF